MAQQKIVRAELRMPEGLKRAVEKRAERTGQSFNSFNNLVLALAVGFDPLLEEATAVLLEASRRLQVSSREPPLDPWSMPVPADCRCADVTGEVCAGCRTQLVLDYVDLHSLDIEGPLTAYVGRVWSVVAAHYLIDDEEQLRRVRASLAAAVQ